MVGIIGGTFDPIHFGHIHLAVMMMETHNLDEVWFIPSLQNPFKKEPTTPFEHRFKMVELAIVGIPSFKALPIEAERPPPSYTIDTVKELKKRHPNKSFHLLLGDDHLDSLSQWKDVKELFEIAPPLVATRSAVPKEIIPLIKNGITKIPLLEISSTMIRERLKKGLYCKHLVRETVLDYIQQNRL
jgi:nicotinate (nicotinamide) nucleotide adenylyltransferase